MARDKRENSCKTSSPSVTSNAGAMPIISSQLMDLGDPIALIEREHALQLTFCDILENMADRLPTEPDMNVVHTASRLLEKSMRPHNRLEDEVLFPLIAQRAGHEPGLIQACQQLKREHSEDTGLAVEINETLRGLQNDGGVSNPDMLGYLLRGYFSSQRRHITWENAVIVPAARRLFHKGDVDRLREWMIENDHKQSVEFLYLAVSSRLEKSEFF